jgi:hypothetical protein
MTSCERHVKQCYSKTYQLIIKQLVNKNIHFKDTVEYWRLVLWPGSQGKFHCHSAKFEPNRRLTIHRVPLLVKWQNLLEHSSFVFGQEKENNCTQMAKELLSSYTNLVCQPLSKLTFKCIAVLIFEPTWAPLVISLVKVLHELCTEWHSCKGIKIFLIVNYMVTYRLSWLKEGSGEGYAVTWHTEVTWANYGVCAYRHSDHFQI